MKGYMISDNVMSESNPKVSLQLSLLTARIARYDWPDMWSNLLETLYQAIESDEWTVSFNATQTFMQVLFVLVSKKLLSAKRQLRDAAAVMLPAFFELWTEVSSQLLHFEESHPISAATDENIESITSHLCRFTQHVCSCVKIFQLLLMLASSSLSSACDPSSQSLVEPIIDSIYSVLLAHIEKYCSKVFDGDLSFIFEQGEYHSAGWASVREWECEDDSTDAFNVAMLFGSLDIQATVEVSPYLQQHSGEHVDGVSAPQQAKLCFSLCLSKVAMSLAVIPLHMHTVSSTRAVIEPRAIPFLQQYFSLLLQQYGGQMTGASCEPLAVVFTMFLSHSFSQADSALEQFLAMSPSQSLSDTQQSVTQSLFELLLTRLLRLPESTLVAWGDDPEELDSVMQSSLECESLRSSAEGLFASMLHHSPDEITDLLLSIVSDSNRQLAIIDHIHCDPISEEILFWEAVYVCCGIGSYHLSQSAQSDNLKCWLTEIVGKILTSPCNPSPNAPQVLYHRLLWLMSCWGYVLDAHVLKQLFNIISVYLDPANFDLMVRLQAVRSLGVLMHCDSFAPEMILEILEPLLTHTCNLVISEVTEAPVRVSIISFFQEIVDSVGISCKPCWDTLLQHVILLWGDDTSGISEEQTGSSGAGDEFEENSTSPLRMIRASLLELFTSFVEIDKGESSDSLYSYIAGPLRYSTSASADSAYLCQQGIVLWSAIIRNCTTLNPYMIELFNSNLPKIFDTDLVGADYTELRTTLSIIESYVIIGGLEFVANNGHTVASLLHTTLGQVRPRAAPHAIRPVEALLLMAVNSESCQDVLNFLLSSDVMTVILRPCFAALGSLTCKDNVVAKETYSGIAALFETFEESDIALVSYLSVCARCIMIDATFVKHCCGHVMESNSLTGVLTSELKIDEGRLNNMLFNALCRLLIEKFDTFGYSKGGIWRRLLSCCSLMSILPSTDPEIVDWLPEIMYICDDVFGEAASDEGKEQIAHLGTRIISIADDDEDDGFNDDSGSSKSPIVTAFESYLSQDPLLTTSFHCILLEKISQMKSLMGEDILQEKVFSCVDNTTLLRLLENSY